MAITVQAVTLNQHVSWIDRYLQGVAGSEKVTLLGRTVVNRLAGDVRDVVFEAREEDNVRKGYFLKAELDVLEGYRDAGTVLSINYHGTTFSAVIKSDGIRVKKALWQSEFDTIEKWIGTITFKRTG